MEPRIQYAKTSDGFNIAFWQMGHGPPLMLTSPVNYSHIELELRIPQLKNWYERLAESWRVIRFDARGWGLSDRRARGYDLEMTGRDIDAVAREADAGTFALFGIFGWGPAAIAYAATRPDRVTHLLTWLTAGGDDNAWRAFSSAPQIASIAGLPAEEWELYTENLAHIIVGWRRGEAAHEYAQLIRVSMSQEFLLSFSGNFKNDSTSRLKDVRCPTMILHSRDNPMINTETATRLAAAIPGARLKILEGRALALYGRVGEEIAAMIGDFMGVETAKRGRELPSGTVAAPVGVILFADIADSTVLTERLGDAAFRAKARELGPALRALVRECGGTPVEGPTLGDGVLAVFTSAREAIEAARRCVKAGDDAGLPLHLGLHAGDVTREKDPDGRDNVYGGAVNVAARISGLSAPGEVLVSETVRSLARTSAGVQFEDRGEQALKGVGEAVRVWAVRPFGGQAL